MKQAKILDSLEMQKSNHKFLQPKRSDAQIFPVLYIDDRSISLLSETLPKS